MSDTSDEIAAEVTADLDRSEFQFVITCCWGPRPDTPERLAPRVQRTLADLTRIDPALGHWLIGFMERQEQLPLTSLTDDDVIRAVAEGVARMEDDVTPDPPWGYYVNAVTDSPVRSHEFKLDVHAGCTISLDSFINTVHLESKPLCAENAALLTLGILKPALLVLVSQWQPSWARLAPVGLVMLEGDGPHTRRGPSFGTGWVIYVSPRFAPLVTPPSSAVTERLPDGGLLMIATEERFSVDNPRHMDVARDIAEALEPVNALPWPPDGPPAETTWNAST